MKNTNTLCWDIYQKQIFLLIYFLPISTSHCYPPITLANRALFKIKTLVTTQNSHVIFLTIGGNNYSFVKDRHGYFFQDLFLWKKCPPMLVYQTTYFPQTTSLSTPYCPGPIQIILTWLSFHSGNPDTPQFSINQKELTFNPIILTLLNSQYTPKRI